MTIPITPDLIRAALAHIPPNLPRNDWARVAMAIKSEFPDETGRELFDRWSEGDTDGYDAKAARSTWGSIKEGGGVTIGTLIRMAQDRGFELPKPEQAASAPSAAERAEQERQRAQRQADETQRQQQAQRQADETQRQQQAHAKAAERARELWGAASDAGAAEHGYVRRKGVQPHGVRVGADGWLLVPLRDAAGELLNVQRIAPAKLADGGPGKLFQRGGRKSGLWCLLGDAAGAAALLVCEGWATGASLHEATGYPVAVAFDAGNLAGVVRVLHNLHPDARIVVCGDDDAATAKRTGTNPGRSKATAATKAVRGLAVFPSPLPADGSDFNDLHQHAGLAAVRACIDAALANADATAQRQTARAPDGERRDPFSVTDAGVYYTGTDKDGNTTAPQWLCGRLEVTARTRDADGQSWGYLLSFNDPAGRPREWAMPARTLAGDGGEYRAALLGMGLSITTSPPLRSRLTEYLQTRHPDVFATCTERTGWHATVEGAVYVTPGEIIGQSDERIVHQTDGITENPFKQRGSVTAWRERIGALCVGNSRLVFAVACAFAGPLVRPGGVGSGGFHLRGDSSSGKTTALRVAASVNGAPSYMQAWLTTDNALEPTATRYCDALLPIDELAQIDGRVAGKCAYMLANEAGKNRALRGSAGTRARLTWRLLFLSAGEVSLSDHMAEAQTRARAGQEVRMVDLAADAGAGMGAFEELHGREGGAALATELGRAAAATYGAPGRAWLEWLAPQWQGLHKRLRERTDALRAAWVPVGASGQVERVAARFALVAVAGELATEAGLTGWPAGESERAVRKCFESWLAQRGGAGNAEVRQMLRAVRRFIELHGSGRFAWTHKTLTDGNDKTLQRAGFRRLVSKDGKAVAKSEWEIDVANGDAQIEYLVLSETFRIEVCAGFDPHAVARALLDRECLIAPERGRMNSSVYVPGEGNVRCYRIPPAIMDIEL